MKQLHSETNEKVLSLLHNYLQFSYFVTHVA